MLSNLEVHVHDTRPTVSLAAFFRELARAPRSALLLDYDGTLAPFELDRTQAVPYPGVTEVLRDIMDTGRTRVVIISGRRAQELGPLLRLSPPPEIWGTHGLERLQQRWHLRSGRHRSQYARVAG